MTLHSIPNESQIGVSEAIAIAVERRMGVYEERRHAEQR